MSVAKKSKPANGKHEREIKRIVSTVAELALPETEWWATLVDLSSNTTFEGVEVFEDEVTYDARTKEFRGNMNVYVSLNFGKGDDEASLSEAFPAQFSGHIKGEKVDIESVTIDTHTFFE